MSENDFDPSVISDTESAVGVFAESIRRVYKGELGGQRFHALVLAPPQRLAGSRGQHTIFKYNARIVKAENNAPIPNPHALIEDPCRLESAQTKDSKEAIDKAIKSHTVFYSTYMSSREMPTGGDIVIVSLNLGSNGGWDLQSGEHIGIARKGAWAAAGNLPSDCKTLAARTREAAATTGRVVTTIDAGKKWNKCTGGYINL